MEIHHQHCIHEYISLQTDIEHYMYTVPPDKYDKLIQCLRHVLSLKQKYQCYDQLNHSLLIIPQSSHTLHD